MWGTTHTGGDNQNSNSHVPLNVELSEVEKNILPAGCSVGGNRVSMCGLFKK